ncbi:MAG: flagellar basal body P-ring formation chaperone FlgA [Candidatus Kapabacteria bacterium]|nr:flagellar basal body P-ring formation chaperone FlgA [Candidatus Kapabacteria bacterium]
MIIAVFQFYVIRSQSESRFSAAKLEKAINQYIMKNVAPDADIIVNKRLVDHVFEEDDVKARCVANPETLRGMCNVRIEFYNTEKIIKKIDIPVRVKIIKEVPVSLRSLQVGSLISQQDLTLQKMDITQYSKESLQTKDALIGATVGRTIPKGWIVSSDYLKAPSIIKRGEKVTISVIQGAVRIRASAVAMQDASVGGTLKVKREGSILQGTVATDGTIIIGTN